MPDSNAPSLPPRTRSLLFICDEWTPEKGGISAFNQAFSRACALRGHRTACLVTQATEEERQDARDAGVTLIDAYVTPSGPILYVPTREALDFGADTIIGHDRITGATAHTWALRLLNGARLVHIVHTVPSHIERYKSTRQASQRAEERESQTRRIASAADVVAAVGPLIASEVRHLLEDGFGSREVVQVNPGLDLDEIDVSRRRVPPARPNILMVGRTSDVELKGLDIAAAAVGAITLSNGVQPILKVRGAPEAEADALHEKLVAIGNFPPHKVNVVCYTTAVGQIKRDLRQATLCIMPSRAEGFGLVAWEAIAAGTPVLVSGNSGAAELLVAVLGRRADSMIVSVNGPFDEVVHRWSDAIRRVLADEVAAFNYAHEVRQELLDVVRWETAVDEMCTLLDLRERETSAAVPQASSIPAPLRQAVLGVGEDVDAHTLGDVDSSLGSGIESVAPNVSEANRQASTALAWATLDDEQFERLLFDLLRSIPEYENVAWLTNTRAPDRGRDLSLDRVLRDGAGGTRRERVIVQAKHWTSRSVNLASAAEAVAGVSLWAPPVVRGLIIATSGRFTTDAVDWIERHNETGAAPLIEMWPDSRLESLLGQRPLLATSYGLRHAVRGQRA